MLCRFISGYIILEYVMTGCHFSSGR